MTKQERLASLDVLRGLDMFVLVVVGTLVQAADAAWHFPAAFMYQFDHPLVGFSAWDLIMPLFIFMCGAAMPLALPRRLEQGQKAFWKHVLGRFALLWLLGALITGGWLGFDPAGWRPYSNTLQAIAAGYLVVAATMALRNRTIEVAVPIALLAVYGLWMHFGGDYTPEGNVAHLVETRILKAVLPAGSRWLCVSHKWFLPTMMFAAVTFAGSHSTRILRSALAPGRRAGLLAALGLVLLAVGWALYPWVPLVKRIMTVSFTCQAIGWSMLLLAACYVVFDIWKVRRGIGLLTLFGRHALLSYLLMTFYRVAIDAMSERLLYGVVRLAGEPYRRLILTGGSVILIVLVLAVYDHLKTRKETK